MLLRATRLGDLRCSTLSWCRRNRISACNAARDRIVRRPQTRYAVCPKSDQACRLGGRGSNVTTLGGRAVPVLIVGASADGIENLLAAACKSIDYGHHDAFG